MTRKKKARPESPLPIDKLERNTFTFSILVIIIGLFCLPNIEKGGDTWYVLLMVFAINVALLAWIIGRIVVRKIRDEREGQ